MWDFPLVPEQASTVAPEVDHLTLFILAINIGITALGFAVLFLFVALGCSIMKALCYMSR